MATMKITEKQLKKLLDSMQKSQLEQDETEIYLSSVQKQGETVMQ